MGHSFPSYLLISPSLFPFSGPLFQHCSWKLKKTSHFINLLVSFSPCPRDHLVTARVAYQNVLADRSQVFISCILLPAPTSFFHPAVIKGERNGDQNANWTRRMKNGERVPPWSFELILSRWERGWTSEANGAAQEISLNQEGDSQARWQGKAPRWQKEAFPDLSLLPSGIRSTGNLAGTWDRYWHFFCWAVSLQTGCRQLEEGLPLKKDGYPY